MPGDKPLVVLSGFLYSAKGYFHRMFKNSGFYPGELEDMATGVHDFPEWKRSEHFKFKNTCWDLSRYANHNKSYSEISGVIRKKMEECWEDIYSKGIRVIKHPTGFCTMDYWIDYEKVNGLPRLFGNAFLIVVRRNMIDQIQIDHPEYTRFSDFHSGRIKWLRKTHLFNLRIQQTECNIIEVDMHDLHDPDTITQIENSIGYKLDKTEKFQTKPIPYIPVKHYHDYNLTVCKPTVVPIGSPDSANMIYECLKENGFSCSDSLNKQINELNKRITGKNLKGVDIDNIKRTAESMTKYELIKSNITENIFRGWLKYIRNIQRLMYVCVVPRVTEPFKKPYKFLSQSTHLWIGENEFPCIAIEKLKEFLQYPIDGRLLKDYYYEGAFS